MSDAFDPNTQPPADQASGPPPGPPPGQDPTPPAMLNPFDPFPKPPTQMAALDPQERRWKERTRPPGSPQPQPQPKPPPQPPQPQPAQGKLPPPWPPKWVPNRRQFYVPAQGNRGPGRWGTPREFPMQPPIWQVPDILMGIGQQLSMFGPPGIAMLALGMNRYTKAFMDGLHKGQREFARQHKEHAKRHARDLDHHTQRMLDEYRTAFSQSSGPDDQQNLEQTVAEIARRNNDNNILGALQNNGIQGVIDQLNWIDAKHSDLRATRNAQDEADQQLELRNPFMVNPVDDMGMPTERQPPPFPVKPQPLTTRPDPNEHKPIQLAGAMPTPNMDVQGAREPDEEHVPRASDRNNPGAWPGGAPQNPVFKPPATDSEVEGDTPKPIPPMQTEKKEPETDEDFERQDEEKRKAGEQTAAAGKPVRLAQADTGTATDAPPPGAQAEAEADDADQTKPGDPFGQAAARANLKAGGNLPGYGGRAAPQTAAPEAAAPEAAKPDTLNLPEIRVTPALAEAQKKGLDINMIESLAQQNVYGQLSATALRKFDKETFNAIERRSAEMNAQLRGIMTRKDLSGDAVFDEVEKINPQLAQELRSIKAGAAAPPTKGPAAQMLKTLMFKADPTFTESNYTARAKTMAYYTSGKGADNIIRLGTSYKHIAEAEAAINALPNDVLQLLYSYTPATQATVDRLYPETAAQVQAAKQAIEVVSSEVNQTLAFGRSAAFERKDLTEHLSVSNPNGTLSRLNELKRLLKSRQDELQSDFDANTSMDFNKIRENISKKDRDAGEGLSRMQREGRGSGQSNPNRVHDYQEYFK